MFTHNVGKSSSSYALSELSYFHGLEKPGTFGTPKGILRNAAAQFSKPPTKGGGGHCLEQIGTNWIFKQRADFDLGFSLDDPTSRS